MASLNHTFTNSLNNLIAGILLQFTLIGINRRLIIREKLTLTRHEETGNCLVQRQPVNQVTGQVLRPVKPVPARWRRGQGGRFVERVQPLNFFAVIAPEQVTRYVIRSF